MIVKEAIGVGLSVEEARENALAQLNAGIEEDVQFDIIATPKKKVLGIFGGSEAKVRVYVEKPDEPVKAVKKQEKPVAKKVVNQPKPKKETPAPAEKPQEKVSEKANSVHSEVVNSVPATSVDKNSKIGKAYSYLSDVLKNLECDDVEANIGEIEGGYKIALEGGDKLGVVIGHRGETLDALQYLTSLIANERGGDYCRVVIDIGNYREKREKALEGLARKTANQVLRTGRNRSLEPMNPYERRIIHTAIQQMDGVSSSSIGDGSNRRVVICAGSNSRARGSYNNNRRNAEARVDSPATKVVEKPVEDAVQSVETKPVVAEKKETKAAGTMLYGKINK